MTLYAMTFHESYGHLPSRILTLVRKYNVSPSDWDGILAAFGYTWQDVKNIPGIPSHRWDAVVQYIESASQDGYYRPSRYL